MHKRTRRHALSRLGSVGVVAVSAVLLTACLGNNAPDGGGGGEITDDPTAPLTVWTDATRLPIFEAYAEAHPDRDVEIVTVSAETVLSKIQLANQAGADWPDVIWASEGMAAALVTDTYRNFPQPLDELLPQDVQDEFGTTLDGCRINGELVCVKNDLAQMVLYYNAPEMERLGYALPATFDEYVELGLRIADENPGYLVDDGIGAATIWEFYWPSGCPISQVTDVDQVKINWLDDRCAHVTESLDQLAAAGVIPTKELTDIDRAQYGSTNHLLMNVGPVWAAQATLKTAWQYPEGALAAAPMFTFPDEDEPWTGAQGGGVYIVSRHSADIVGSADLVEWVSTNAELQSKQVTMPAYGPAQAAWAEVALAQDPLWFEDPTETFVSSAQFIRPTFNPTRYDPRVVWADVVVSSVRTGKTIGENIERLQNQAVNLAGSTGYVVEQ